MTANLTVLTPDPLESQRDLFFEKQRQHSFASDQLLSFLQRELCHPREFTCSPSELDDRLTDHQVAQQMVWMTPEDDVLMSVGDELVRVPLTRFLLSCDPNDHFYRLRVRYQRSKDELRWQGFHSFPVGSTVAWKPAADLRLHGTVVAHMLDGALWVRPPEGAAFTLYLARVVEL